MEKFHPELHDIKVDVELWNTMYWKRVPRINHISLTLERFTHDFETFSQRFNSTIKPYIIHDEKSFYEFHPNFDAAFYRETYFKNVEISDIDMMAFYHTKGRNQGHKPNSKKRILFFTCEFNEHIGGSVCTYHMVETINRISDTFCAELIVTENTRYKNSICNRYANDIYDKDSIAVYPQSVTGNPLGLKRVVRWIVLDLGMELPYTPVDHDKTFGPHDLIYLWCKKSKHLTGEDLHMHYIHPSYKNLGLERTNRSCHFFKKQYLYHKNIQHTHPHDSIELDNIKNHEKQSNIFNTSKYCYCYDPDTMFIRYAMMCGCIPIIYPIEGESKEEFAKIHMQETSKGYAYGDSKEEIEFASQTLEEGAREIISKIEGGGLDTVKSFLKDLEERFDTWELNKR